MGSIVRTVTLRIDVETPAEYSEQDAIDYVKWSLLDLGHTMEFVDDRGIDVSICNVAAVHEGAGADKMWLNAFSCVRPSDEFAAALGRDIVTKLMNEGVAKIEPLDPMRRMLIEVVCS